MAKPRIGIIGATGFTGRELSRQSRAAGWRVTGFSRAGRGPEGAVEEWRTWGAAPDLSGLDALVNLAGHPVDRRWTKENLRMLRESRVELTRELAAALGRMPSAARPAVLVNGSAVGIYGDRGDEILEESAEPGEGFLAELCRDWEEAAASIPALGVRTVLLRTGLAFGRDGGAFPKMSLPFRYGLGGRLGSGRQWMPWIHVSDLAAAILHAIDHPTLAGPVHGSAPGPERNRDFARALGRALRRPVFLPVPELALKLAAGGFASAILASQRAIPRALLESGFRFRFPGLSEALRDLVG